MDRLSDDILIDAVSVSNSISEVIRHIGYSHQSSAYRMVRKMIGELGLDTSHWNKPPKIFPNAAPWELVFMEDSPYPNANRQGRIRKHQILPYQCECGQGPMWNGKPLSLQLDHINGKNTDNRLENLRFLCPNCHTQTDTFGCRKNRKAPPECIDCGGATWKAGSRCKQCAKRVSMEATKIKWPPIECLLEEVGATSKNAVAKRLGVSFQAVVNHLKIRTTQ